MSHFVRVASCVILASGACAHASMFSVQPGATGSGIGRTGNDYVSVSTYQWDGGVLPQPLTTPSDSFRRALTSSSAATSGGRWGGVQGWMGGAVQNIDWGGSLNGTLFVDAYSAATKNDDPTRGGAELLVRYVRGDGDPLAKDLHWINVVDSTMRLGAESAAYPDIYKSGYDANGRMPFYYRDDESLINSNGLIGGHRAGMAPIRDGSYTIDGERHSYDMAFYDFPGRAAGNEWRGELFLASFDEVTGRLTVYDGLRFGFDTMVPQPASVAVFAVCMLPALRRRREAEEISPGA